MLVFYQLAQLALAGDDVVQVQAAELDLLRQRALQQALFSLAKCSGQILQ
jgi:hypothetical protein